MSYERYAGHDGEDGLPVFTNSAAGLAAVGPCPLCPNIFCRFLLWGYKEMPGQGTFICRHGLRWSGVQADAQNIDVMETREAAK